MVEGWMNRAAASIHDRGAEDQTCDQGDAGSPTGSVGDFVDLKP